MVRVTGRCVESFPESCKSCVEVCGASEECSLIAVRKTIHFLTLFRVMNREFD